MAIGWFTQQADTQHFISRSSIPEEGTYITKPFEEVFVTEKADFSIKTSYRYSK